MNNLNYFLELLKEYEGIIGAVFGSVTTLITTDFLRKKGKCKIYLVFFEGKYKTYNDVGCYKENDSDFYSYEIHCKYQVYNGSDIPKIMRDFKVSFIKDTQEVYSVIPKDKTTARISNKAYNIEEMEIFNISPKEIRVIEQSVYVSEKDLDLIEATTKIELSYYDEKETKRKFNLTTEKISKHNYVSKK